MTDEVVNGKKHETIVYIYNMSEDVWPFIRAMTDDHSKAEEINENAELVDRDLFTISQEDNVLFISPRPISEDLLLYYNELIGNKNVRVLITKVHTGLTCEDILRDSFILSEIEKAANSSRKLTLLSYTTSFQFLNLVSELRKKGLTIYTPEAPEEEDGWTVNFYGSKSGIRQLAQKSGAIEPDFKMADGLICTGVSDAAKIAAKRYVKEGAVVLKTNKGHSGLGLFIYRPGDLPAEYNACVKTISTALKKEGYWDKFPIIIEDYIAQAITIGGGFPNVEFKVLKSGKVEFLYYCGLRVTPQGAFQGIEIHNDVISDRVAAQITDTGFFIGEQYASEGYRGYFDVDFVAGKNGQIYVTESNVRRTGGTHVYHTAMRLFGKDFMYETYILSNNSYQLPHGPRYSMTGVIDHLRPFMYDKQSKEGIVIISENLFLRSKLAYIIFGKSKKRALEIESSMESLLMQLAER